MTIGIVGMIAQLGWLIAGRFLEAGMASFLRSFDIIFTYMWQWLMFNDAPTWITIIGACLVLSCNILCSIQKVENTLKNREKYPLLKTVMFRSNKDDAGSQLM